MCVILAIHSLQRHDRRPVRYTDSHIHSFNGVGPTRHTMLCLLIQSLQDNLNNVWRLLIELYHDDLKLQDNLLPVSCKGQDWQGGIGLTLVDALDTLLVSLFHSRVHPYGSDVIKTYKAGVLSSIRPAWKHEPNRVWTNEHEVLGNERDLLTCWGRRWRV